MLLILYSVLLPVVLFAQEGERSNSFAPSAVIEAFAAAYPEIITIPAQTSPYPMLSVRGTNFYFVEGRFLPSSETNNWEKYRPNMLYHYPKEIPDPLKRTEEELNTLRERSSKSHRSKRAPSSETFYETLYGINKLSDTNNILVKSRFLNKQVLIHQLICEPLKAVQQEIYALTNSSNKSEIIKFLNETDLVYSFYWRNISGTQSRSQHSYGTAIDILSSKNKKATYWLWRHNLKIDWAKEPISVRWNPPAEVVEIFEKHGFVWGGKWNFYDTMHFEYKPEILLLNGYPL